MSSADAFAVTTFNIRQAWPGDGANLWEFRRPIALNVIQKAAADVLCLQEPYDFQVDAVAAALPDHQLVGVGRDDGIRAGEWSPIFVNRRRFVVEESGTFWLSETPTVPGSCSWDALAYPRICTWALVRDRHTGAALFVCNSHWDHEGLVAREHSAAMIAARLVAVSQDVPVVVTGDFNADPSSLSVRYLVGAGSLTIADAPPSPRLQDVWASLHPESGPNDATTYHSFAGKNGPRIDYILINPHLRACRCTIDKSRSDDGRYPSDHYPVSAILQWQ